MGMYYPPIRSDEIYHWGIKKGEESKKHKYYARELIGTKNGKNIYRYFYTKAAHDMFKGSKNLANQVSNAANGVRDTVGRSASNFQKSIKGVINQVVVNNTAYSYMGKKLVSNLLYKAPESQKKETIAKPGQSVNHTLLKKVHARDEYVKKNPLEGKYTHDVRVDKEAIQKEAKAKKQETDLPTSNPSGEKKYKYIARIERPDGKGYYYFYDQNAYFKWLRKNGGNEEELAKTFGLKRNPQSEEEDMAEINEKKQANGDRRHNNCWSCATAYELRRRGYDVEATISDTGKGETTKTILSIYDKKPINMYHDRTCKTREEAEEIFNDNKKCAKQAEKIIKSCLDSNPEGSRGYFTLEYRSGTGHIANWEIKNGKLIVRDAQVNTSYTDDELISYFDHCSLTRRSYTTIGEGGKESTETFWSYDMQWIRTDNLEIKNIDTIKKNPGNNSGRFVAKN